MPCSITQAADGWTITCTDGSRRTFATRAEAVAWCRRKNAIPQPDHAEGGMIEEEGCAECASLPVIDEDRAARCAAACEEASVACTAAASNADGELRRLLLDCADLCRASSALQARNSPWSAGIRGLCAEACARTAQRCAAAGATFAACADACRRCADGCAGC